MFQKTLPRYEGYLQLHDNYTIWDLDNKKRLDDDYFDLVNLATEEFKDITGIDLHLLGRSGRHVCIEDNINNSKNYKRYQNLALKLEQQVIDRFNEKI